MTSTMITSAEIALLEETRQAAMLRAVAPLTQPFAGGVMGFHEPGSWQNQASGVGLHGPVDDAEIDAMVEFYVSRGVEPRVELAPFADQSLIDGLAKRGFVVREFEHVLARELPPDEPLDTLLAEVQAPELKLEPLDRSDADAVMAVVEVVLRGFFPTGELPPAMVEACRATTCMPIVHSVTARIDGELAAAGSVHLGEQVASLMGVSTKPTFRRRGIQQALIVARLLTARAHGCRLATIGSRPGMPTERNAIRLGFRIAYTKVIVARPGEGLATSV